MATGSRRETRRRRTRCTDKPEDTPLMNRFYCPNLEAEVLSREESHHASKVLRLQSGDICEVFDGQGRSAQVRLSQMSKQAVRYEILCVNQAPAPAVRLILGQGIPKGRAWDLILQKSVELSVQEIYPIMAAHSIPQVAGQQHDKWEKWHQVVIAACKQCRQNHLPRLHEPAGMPHFLAATQQRPALKLIASLQPGALPLKNVLADNPPPTADPAVIFLVGPEGDFSSAEIQSAIQAGYLPVNLGAHTLRSETATLYLASVLAYSFNHC